jgi:hypothetical protein
MGQGPVPDTPTGRRLALRCMSIRPEGCRDDTFHDPRRFWFGRHNGERLTPFRHDRFGRLNPRGKPCRRSTGRPDCVLPCPQARSPLLSCLFKVSRIPVIKDCTSSQVLSTNESLDNALTPVDRLVPVCSIRPYRSPCVTIRRVVNSSRFSEGGSWREKPGIVPGGERCQRF